MLTALRQLDALKVLARDSLKHEAPFQCPRCKGELVLRKGNIKVHHFAHKPPITCSDGAGETEQHYRAKMEMFDALRVEPAVTELEIEKDFGASIADLFLKIAGVAVAIDIQRSALTVNDITIRTKNYHRLGIAVLWLGLQTPELDRQQYSPRAWEKWCHGTYFGRVYYWSHGQVICPVHFGPYLIHVPASSWYEDGSEQSAGGYYKRSKRWRTPQPGEFILLSQHFMSRHRPAWNGGTVVVPESTLYVDRQPKWWNEA